MSLRAIVAALGGELYAGGRRANVPAPGHSPADRSVSLLLADGRVVAHSFGAASWRDVLDDLRARGLIDATGAPTGAALPGAVRLGGSDLTGLERVAAAQALWCAGAALRDRAPAGRYCRWRGIEGDLIELTALRSHPSAPVAIYRPAGRTMPALLAAVTDAFGEITAVEVTYLDPNGRRTRALRLSRKTVGRLPAGSAVRLASMSPELLVAEGVFTALSAMAAFQLPGWALLSASNLRRWGPPDGVRRVLIAADRGRGGEAAAAELRERLVARGVAAVIRLPPRPHGDWNEAAQAEGRRKGADGRPARREGP